MIYIVVLILLLLLTINYDFSRKRKFSNKWFNFILLIFILIAGFRYKVGGDTQAYYDYYETVKNWDETNISELLVGRFAFLWNVFATTCKSISEDFVVLQFVQAVFVNSTLFWFIKKYSKFRFTSLLIYYLFAYLYFNMEIMRESIAISFFLLAYPYFNRKSWVKYYLIAVVSFLFHTSAVIIFLFPLLRILRFNIRNLLIITALSISLIILLANSPELLNLLLFTETIESNFREYSKYAFNLNGKFFVLISYIGVPFALLLINRKVLKRRYALFESLYFVYFTIAIIYLLFSGFSRFINYMTPFMVVYLADLLNNIFANRSYNETIKRLFIISLLFILFIPKLLYYSSDTSRFYPETTKYNLYYPYSSVFTKEEYDFRRIIFVEGLREAANINY